MYSDAALIDEVERSCNVCKELMYGDFWLDFFFFFFFRFISSLSLRLRSSLVFVFVFVFVFCYFKKEIFVAVFQILVTLSSPSVTD